MLRVILSLVVMCTNSFVNNPNQFHEVEFWTAEKVPYLSYVAVVVIIIASVRWWCILFGVVCIFELPFNSEQLPINSESTPRLSSYYDVKGLVEIHSRSRSSSFVMSSVGIVDIHFNSDAISNRSGRIWYEYMMKWKMYRRKYVRRYSSWKKCECDVRCRGEMSVRCWY